VQRTLPRDSESRTMTLVQQAGVALILVLITLFLQCAGAASLILWIRSIPRQAEGAGFSVRRTRHANYASCHRLTWNRHSAMGWLLQVAMPPLLGIGFLFFGQQLCDCWRRCNASVEVAPARSARKHGRYADVRGLNWPSVRGCDAFGRQRVAVPSTTPLRVHECESDRTLTTLALSFPQCSAQWVFCC
jgi:hypothetical protein